MMIWLWIVIVVIALIVVAAFSAVRTHIVYTRDGYDDQFDIRIKALFGLLHFNYSVPSIKFEGLLKGISVEREVSTNIPLPNSKHLKSKADLNIDRKFVLSSYEKWKVLIHHVLGFHHWLLCTLEHTHCTKILWSTDVGLDDAADTAITTGIIWGIKTSILGALFNRIKLEAQPQLAVVPQFNQMMLRTHFDCSLMIRLGYALYAGIRLFIRIYKVKGGLRTWQKNLSKA